MCSLRNSLLLLLCIGVAAPAAARPRGPAAVWPGVSDVLLNVRVPAMTAARHIRVAAWGEDSEEPGSVLVFPSVHTGRVNTADAGVLPRTRFEISVTCPPDDPDFDCSSVGTVYLRAHWVCGGDATGVCAEVDFNLSTTINGTITFNTENIGPRTDDVPAPPNCVSNPGEEEEGGGYLIVWVIDSPSSGRAIKSGPPRVGGVEQRLPGFSAIARDLDISIIRSDPDQIFVLRRFADRINRGVHLGGGIVHRDAA